MFVCLAIYTNPSHFTRDLLNGSIQNMETRAVVDIMDMAAHNIQ